MSYKYKCLKCGKLYNNHDFECDCITPISEEQATKMLNNYCICKSSLLALWKEKGYIKQELKPCPFCGNYTIKFAAYGTLYCTNCFIGTEPFGTKDLKRNKQEAIKAWNRRS